MQPQKYSAHQTEMKKPTPPVKQSHVMMLRMSPALKERIRKYQVGMQEETGFKIGFATAARRLIEECLDQKGVK